MKNIIQIIHRRRNMIGVASLAVGTALMLSSTVLAAPMTTIAEKLLLADQCARAVIPQGAHIHTVLDPESNTVAVTWYTEEQEHNFNLPYSPGNNFRGCNPSNNAVLTQVRENYNQEVQDTCTEFKAILGGQIPMPTKNGQTGNPVAAQRYVARHCQ